MDENVWLNEIQHKWNVRNFRDREKWKRHWNGTSKPVFCMLKIKYIFVQKLKKEANAHFLFKWFFFVYKQQILSNGSLFLVRINANTRSKVKPLRHVHHSYMKWSAHAAREREHANNFNVQNIDRAARTHFSPETKKKLWAKTITVTHSLIHLQFIFQHLKVFQWVYVLRFGMVIPTFGYFRAKQISDHVLIWYKNKY